MTRSEMLRVAGLVTSAQALYHDDPAALAELDGYAVRLREPLRLAVAGMVKAGKSTLLNAIIGEQIAPTDAGECTRTITWYRHGASPRITVHLGDGTTWSMPIHRVRGRLVLDLGPWTADDVAWIDVEWPAEALRSLILIDTPGVASLSSDVSARSSAFLFPDDAPPAADAIVYLLRYMHASDLGFLESFRDTAAGASETVNAVAVLSRADEIGSGRIDSLLSAARIAERYRGDGELRALALDVLPVAGLLAEAGTTVREHEFDAFCALADLAHEERERLLISVDRFTAPGMRAGLDHAERQELLGRFGIFGVRLGAALVRAGAASASELAERMVQQSGLIDLERFIDAQFRSRIAVLKCRAVLDGLQRLTASRSRQGDDVLRGGIERALAGMHELRELALIAALRTATSSMPAEEAAEAERLVGGFGVDPLVRLGLPEG
ncbi:MAG TPA: dynamin family protein, partial [Agromyces sp.]